MVGSPISTQHSPPLHGVLFNELTWRAQRTNTCEEKHQCVVMKATVHDVRQCPGQGICTQWQVYDTMCCGKQGRREEVSSLTLCTCNFGACTGRGELVAVDTRVVVPTFSTHRRTSDNVCTVNCRDSDFAFWGNDEVNHQMHW